MQILAHVTGNWLLSSARPAERRGSEAGGPPGPASLGPEVTTGTVTCGVPEAAARPGWPRGCSGGRSPPGGGGGAGPGCSSAGTPPRTPASCARPPGPLSQLDLHSGSWGRHVGLFGRFSCAPPPRQGLRSRPLSTALAPRSGLSPPLAPLPNTESSGGSCSGSEDLLFSQLSCRPRLQHAAPRPSPVTCETNSRPVPAPGRGHLPGRARRR